MSSCRKRKTSTRSLWDVLGGQSLHQRRLKLLEKMGSSEVVRERFWAKAEIKGPDECWNWRGSVFKRGGYARFGIKENGKDTKLRANRVAYYFHYAVYPGYFYVCHTCDNPKCVNPNHLYLGTYLDNNRDKIDRGRTPQGTKHSSHLLTEAMVVEFRYRCLVLGETRDSVAKQFNLKPNTVVNAVLGRSWKHVPMPDGLPLEAEGALVPFYRKD